MRIAWLIGVWALFPSTIALYLGRSNIQAVDLIRRTMETLAVFLSWLGIKKINKLDDYSAIGKIEFINKSFVSLAMFISFIVVLYLSISRFFNPLQPGILWPGIVVAAVDFIVNFYFARRNYQLNQSDYSLIMEAQWKLYTAKTSINLSVLISLISFYIINDQVIIRLINLLAGLIIAFFLLFLSINIMRKNQPGKEVYDESIR